MVETISNENKKRSNEIPLPIVSLHSRQESDFNTSLTIRNNFSPFCSYKQSKNIYQKRF